MTKALTIPATTYTRGAWIDRYGHKHPATTIHRKSYKTRDKGKKGRTPRRKRWYKPKVHMGWRKGQPTKTRRTLALEAHGGSELSTARALQALANVTTDTKTRRLATSDARYFFELYQEDS